MQVDWFTQNPIGLLNVQCFTLWFCYSHAILMFLFQVLGSIQSMHIVCCPESHVNNFSTLALFAFQGYCCRSLLAQTPQELQTKQIKRWLHRTLVVTPVLIGSLYRYVDVYVHLFLSLSISISIYISLSLYIYIYIHIFIVLNTRETF